MPDELKNLPKKGWRTVRFDEIAQLVNDRVANPAESGVERYVGLEHLDSESLKIRRWGKPTDVEAQKLRFQPGDIIFGKRRAYQRKVAVADFEGICSAHAMVLRAREENIVKDFLPFFMQSDAFFEVALSISVGSLSPTINWKTLAEQKFTIPPKDEQKRIAEILWAADTTIRNYLEAKDEQTKVKWILFDELFLKPNNAKTLPLRMCMKERSESAKAPFSNEKYLALEHIESGESEIKLFANSKNVSSVCSVFKKGDLLYGKLRPYLDKAAISSDEGICSTEILVLEPIKEVTTANFLIHHFHSPDFIKHNVHQSYGTKMPRTSFKIVGDYPIQMPSLSEQKDILHKMQCFEDSQKALNENLTSLEVLKKQLIKNLIEV